MLSPEEKRELSQFYWETDLSSRELEEHFSLSKPAYMHINPKKTDKVCPNCESALVYRSRSARDRDDAECNNCEHSSRSIYSCKCNHCRSLKAERDREREEERVRREISAFNETIEEVSTNDYVFWALRKVNRREKLFLRSFLEVVQSVETPTWEEICDRAGVVTHKPYLDRLSKLKLLIFKPEDGVIANPSLELDMIEIKRARNISKSTRFEVFQRDRHICQYCGRTPPEVELEVDHLLPVSRGGTDQFENLVTSCRDCNRGKSAKIIEEFTGGHSKDAWREELRERRRETLRDRREQLEEVMEYWSECRGSRSLSHYDTQGIYRFMERYDPEWIKAAIRIAASKSPSNYVKYVAGILRNWGRDGAPDYVDDPESRLKTSKATEKQVQYIESLLSDIGIELGDFYFKDNLEDLTMLDARNLIAELTENSINGS